MAESTAAQRPLVLMLSEILSLDLCHKYMYARGRVRLYTDLSAYARLESMPTRNARLQLFNRLSNRSAPGWQLIAWGAIPKHVVA